MTALIPALISLLQGQMGGGGGGGGSGKPPKTPEEIQDDLYRKKLESGSIYGKDVEIPELQKPMTFQQQLEAAQKSRNGGQ